MKKLVFTLVVLATFTLNASAMSYEQAREQALFLTDKMAYELNLTPDQYDAAYEINLDYLMGVSTADEVFNDYWTRRNLDLSYVLLDWQYRMFCDALYFYRPLYWDAGFWHFRIYARYPHRGWFYFDRPRVYISYHGEHCWRNFGDRGYYHGRVFAHTTVGTSNHSRARIEGGMRDNWNGKGRNFGNNDRGGNGMNHGNSGFNRGNGNFNRDNNGSNRDNNGFNRDNNTDNRGGNGFNRGNRGGEAGNNTGSMDNRRTGGTVRDNNISSTRETVTNNRSNGNGGFNHRYSTTTPTQTTRPATSTRSVGTSTRSVSTSRPNVTGGTFRGSSSVSHSSGFGGGSHSSSMSHGSFGGGHSGGGHAGGGFGRGGHR